MAYSLTLIVQYNANGGSGAPSSSTRTVLASSLPHTVSVTIPPATPTRSGYTFLGWSANSSASSASYSAGGSYSYTFAEEGTRTTTLYAVWSARKSTISLHDGTTAATIDDQTVIDITRYNSSYTHTITYAFGNASGTIANKTSSTSITWAIPASLASQIPSATRATCALTCTTYNGNTSLGTTTLTITLFVKQSVKVTIGSVSISEGYASMPSGITAYVQGKSKLAFAIGSSTSGAYGATVSSVSTTVGGKTYSGASFTTDAIGTSGSVSYSITLTDSRGRTDTRTGSVTVAAYHSPTPVITSVVRDAANPTRAIVSYTWNVSAINNQNAKTLKVLYKLTTASSYSQATSITPSGYSGSTTYTLNPSPSGLDAAYPYNVQIQLTDSFTTVSYTLTLASSGSRYIECDKSTGTVIFPLKTQHVGASIFNNDVAVSRATAVDTGVTAERTDKGTSVFFGIGSGGYNHGVYSNTNNEWIICKSQAGNTLIASAPYLAGHNSPIGTIKTENLSSNTTIATGTNKAVVSITLAAGTWIIVARARFSANATGYRHINISTTSADSGAHVQVPAVSGAVTQLALTRIVSHTANTTYYLNAYQSSGSTLTMAAGSGGEINALTAIRIV